MDHRRRLKGSTSSTAPKLMNQLLLPVMVRAKCCSASVTNPTTSALLRRQKIYLGQCPPAIGSQSANELRRTPIASIDLPETSAKDNRRMRPHSQLLILALLGIQVAAQSSCDPVSLGQATATKVGEDATATAAAAAAVATAEDGGTSTATGDGFQDAKILSQTPPIRAFSRGNPTVDALYMMFPALGSLIHWGSLFPAYSFLGAPAPGSEAAASKVVLVLADDAAAKTRVTRQNDPASQPNPFSFLTNTQNLQGFPNVANFDPNMLGQSLMNPQTAFTALQGLPGLSGLQGMLGAPGPVSTPAAAPAADAAAAAAATASSSAPAAEAASAPAAVPVPVLGQTPWNLQNFDTNNMLGQTMNLLSQMPQMPPVQAPANLPVPNFNFLSQMFPTPAASDISEVRVRPEVAYAPEAQVAQLKIKTALEKETEKVQQQEEQERVPLLWFRMPSNPTSEDQRTAEDLRVEAKLRAFERQVIAELKMLQKIELMAKEMRSSASASQGKDSPYKISYPLSRTPVHKITRSDIERALRDDYVRRLLQKEAQRKARISDLQRSTGGYKRQAEKPGQSMSKEDIVQIMAYAYRMASEQMAEKEKQDKIYAAYRTGSEDSTKPMERQQQEQMQQQRQMVQEMQQMQQQQERQFLPEIPGAFQHRQMMQGPQMIQQNPMMTQQQQERQMMQQQQHERQMIQQQQERQMMADPQVIQQRQMIQGPQMIQQNPTMPRQIPEIQMIQQQQQERQMMADPQAIQQMQQRQWTEEQAKIQQRQMAAEDQQMMQQRQMMAEDPQAIQQMQQRQWAEEQAKIQQNAMMMQQQQQQRQMMQDSAQMMQQRQMAAENQPAQSQNQQPIQWTEDPSRIQQIQQMQQRSEDQQRQVGGQATTMTMPAERQWADEKSKAIHQMSQQPEQVNEESEDLILGEAGPQMPENEGTARHKGNLYGVFRNRDSISVSPTVDSLGLGGNQRKKSKSKSKSGGTPTVVNLYYSTPAQRPSYGPSYAPPSYAPPSYAPPSYAPRPSYSAPSYGTSYGGGGYGSNAYGAGGSSYQRPAPAGYRAAVGNDEVDEMLRRHQTLARTINPQPGQVAGSPATADASMTTTTPAPSSPTHQIHKRLAIFHSRFGRDRDGDEDGSNSAPKGCACGRSQCSCGRSCQCGSSRGLDGGLGSSKCPCKALYRRSNRRNRRSTAEYGTLETIDEGSLNELRREYKMGLKEITLSPDEDPAEALMRYNAASIREALERASQVPLEIGGDEYAEDLPQEPVDAEQLQHDSHQHQHHHHQYHHQYHHQDFVRLTTAAPPPSNTTEASATSEATPTSTTTSTTTTTVSPPAETETLDEAEMQQDSAASETLRVAEAMSLQKEEIHELHKAVHALKLQLLDANRRCKKIQEQLKVNLVKEPEQEEELEKEPKEENEKKPITEEEPKAQEQTRELEKEPEKPKALKDKSGTENQAKEEKQPEQEEGEDQEEDTECTGTSTTTTETPVTPSPPPPPPPSPPSQRSQEANAIAKVDRELGTASAVASASIDANKLGYEEEEGNWQRILANRGYDTDYLTKSHERQYAEGGNLELPKGSPYEAPLSQEYSSYPEFQADEPAPVSDSEVKAKRAAAPLSVKLRAHMLNVALNGSGRRDASTAPTPYALRGKFMRRQSTAGSSAGRKKNSRISQISQEELESPSDEGWVRSTRQAKMPQRLQKKITPKKKEASSARVTTQASVSSTKLDRLVDVLNDLLRLQLQKERRSSALKSNASLKSKNVLAKTSASSKLVKRKRLRRRQQSASSSTIRSHIGIPSSAPSDTETTAPPASAPPSDPQVGSIFTYGEGLLHPFMGLLPVERSDDPWNTKPYDPHYPLYTGGGSYAAYLRDGRHRRDTHIMGSQPGQGILTPGMLERLLRIKIDFQRRFPHLYKGMLSHHQNQTRVEVEPPILGKIKSDDKKPKAKPTKQQEQEEEAPVYELGAAERSLFEDETERDSLGKESEQEAEVDPKEVVAKESSEREPKDNISSEPWREDNDIDYFEFDDDDDVDD